MIFFDCDKTPTRKKDFYWLTVSEGLARIWSHVLGQDLMVVGACGRTGQSTLWFRAEKGPPSGALPPELQGTAHHPGTKH